MSDLRPKSDQQRTWTGLLKAIRPPHDTNMQPTIRCQRIHLPWALHETLTVRR
jgi:hypothetical protein